MTCGVRGRRAFPRTRRKGPTARTAAATTAATQNTTMSTADSWHTELGEERREPKDLSKRPHQFFAGLHERAILPEATEATGLYPPDEHIG